MSFAIRFDPHPLARPAALAIEFPVPLSELPSRAPAAEARVPELPETLRQAVRQMLRHGGYKPTGRGKPSSEYLAKAAADGQFPAINLPVDAGNRVSLESGLPISVIDRERAVGPLSIRLASAGQDYVFNASGQSIDVEGLLCLFDAEGPCANAVKDAQRTKTTPGSRLCLALIWGLAEDPGRTLAALERLRAELPGARLEEVPLICAPPAG